MCFKLGTFSEIPLSPALLLAVRVMLNQQQPPGGTLQGLMQNFIVNCHRQKVHGRFPGYLQHLTLGMCHFHLLLVVFEASLNFYVRFPYVASKCIWEVDR